MNYYLKNILVLLFFLTLSLKGQAFERETFRMEPKWGDKTGQYLEFKTDGPLISIVDCRGASRCEELGELHIDDLNDYLNRTSAERKGKISNRLASTMALGASFLLSFVLEEGVFSIDRESLVITARNAVEYSNIADYLCAFIPMFGTKKARKLRVALQLEKKLSSCSRDTYEMMNIGLTREGLKDLINGLN